MTPEEFNKRLEEYRDRRVELEQQIADLKTERQTFINDYVNEAFKKSGYALGQKILDKRSRTWYVSGAHETHGHVYLTFNFAKKDGTMSKVSGIGRGEPTVRIK